MQKSSGQGIGSECHDKEGEAETCIGVKASKTLHRRDNSCTQLSVTSSVTPDLSKREPRKHRIAQVGKDRVQPRPKHTTLSLTTLC